MKSFTIFKLKLLYMICWQSSLFNQQAVMNQKILLKQKIPLKQQIPPKKEQGEIDHTAQSKLNEFKKIVSGVLESNKNNKGGLNKGILNIYTSLFEEICNLKIKYDSKESVKLSVKKSIEELNSKEPETITEKDLYTLQKAIIDYNRQKYKNIPTGTESNAIRKGVNNNMYYIFIVWYEACRNFDAHLVDLKESIQKLAGKETDKARIYQDYSTNLTKFNNDLNEFKINIESEYVKRVRTGDLLSTSLKSFQEAMTEYQKVVETIEEEKHIEENKQTLLKNRLLAVETRIPAAKTDLKTLKTEDMSKLEKDINKLEEDIKQLKEEKKLKEEEINKLEKDINKLEKDIKNLKDLVNTRTTEQQQKEYERQQEEKRQKEEKQANLKKRLKEVEKVINEAEIKEPVLLNQLNIQLKRLAQGEELNEQDIINLEASLKKYQSQSLEVYKKSTPEMMEYLKRFNWLELKNKMMAERPYQSLEEQWKSLKAYTNILKQQCFDLLELLYECKVKSNYFAYDTVMTREGAEKVKQARQSKLVFDTPDEKQQAEEKEDEAFRACVEDHNREGFISKKDDNNAKIEEQSGKLRHELETFPEKIKQLKNKAIYNANHGKMSGEGLLGPIDYGVIGTGLGAVAVKTINNFSYDKSIPDNKSK